MQPKPIVSVIIPVFNTGRYLEEAVSSILNQTLEDIEVIVVNDGSTDNSVEVLATMSATDSRIRLFSQKNQGQSVARNLGLDNARGEYVYFMDSDDILEKDALRRCFEKCKKENLEMVFFDADMFSDEEIPLSWDYIRAGKVTEDVCTGVEVMERLAAIGKFRVSPCLIFVKRDLIENGKLRFYPGIIHEDELFIPKLHFAITRAAYIPITLFHRRVRGNSTMTNSFSHRNLNGYLTVMSELRRFSKGRTEREVKLIDKLISVIVNPVIYQSNIFPMREKVRILNKLYNIGALRFIKWKNIAVFICPCLLKAKPIIMGMLK